MANFAQAKPPIEPFPFKMKFMPLNTRFCLLALSGLLLSFSALAQNTTEEEYKVMKNPDALEKVCEAGVLTCNLIGRWYEEAGMYTYTNVLRKDNSLVGVAIKAQDLHSGKRVNLAIPFPNSNAYHQLCRQYTSTVYSMPQKLQEGLAVTWPAYVFHFHSENYASTGDLEPEMSLKLSSINSACEEGSLQCKEVGSWTEDQCTYTYTHASWEDGGSMGIGIKVSCGEEGETYHLSLAVSKDQELVHEFYRQYTTKLYAFPEKIRAGIAATWPLYFSELVKMEEYEFREN